MTKDASLTIGLLWHSVNSTNLGIGALTISHITIIDKIARELDVSIRYRVIGWRDAQPTYIERPDLDVLWMRARDLLKPHIFRQAILKCDVVLDISAGDSFADIYGTRRFFLNAISKAIVLSARKPLILSPQTIGPFRRRWSRIVAGILMRSSHNVVVRDNLSMQFLEPLHLGEKLVEATDVAFRLPYDALPSPQTPDKIRFGLNISGLLFNGGYTKKNMFALAVDYPELVRSIIAHFSSIPECELHLVGHVNSDHNVIEDDYRVSKKLAAEFPGVIVAPQFKDPIDAKNYIARMDFFCGSRMHACIAAFSSEVPVFPIAYSRKFIGVFGSLGYTHVSDCQNQSASEILAAVIHAFGQRAKLKAMVKEGCSRADSRLSNYEAILSKALANASRRCG